jgi:hypothetical protein
MKQLTGLWWRLVRFGFRLLYNEMAFTYDAVSAVVSLGEWRSWQRAALNFLPPLSAPRAGAGARHGQLAARSAHGRHSQRRP